MHISLRPEQERFITGQIEAGRYTSADEVIEAAVSLLADREQRLEALCREIQKGVESGPATPLDMATIKAEARRRWEQQR